MIINNSNNNNNKKKKGISTIIAAVFIVGIIVIGLNAMIWALDLQNGFGQFIIERNVLETERNAEKIEVRDVKIENEKFNMTIANTGNLPVHMVRLWVTNTTDTNGWHQQYDTDEIINPGEVTYIGSSPPLDQLVALNSSSYKINIVTERGNSNIFQILSPKDKAQKMSLIGTPRSIPTNQNVTLLFGVKNNLTDGSMVQTIEPSISWTITEAPVGTETVTVTLVEGPTPVTEESLILGETVFFEYVYIVSGDKNDFVTFNATITDAKIGNFVTESVYVVVDDLAFQSESAVITAFITNPAGTEDPETMFFRRGLGLDGYQLEHIIPDDVTGVEHEINSTSTTVKFYTANMALDITFGDGKAPYWIEHRIHYKTTDGEVDIRILAEEVSANGQTVIDTIQDYTSTWDDSSSCSEKTFSPSYTGPKTIDAGNRLRISFIYITGPSNMMTFCYDSTNEKSRFHFMDGDGMEIPSNTFPSWPAPYTGGDVNLQVNHPGPSGLWLDYATRVVFNDTASDTSYSAFLYKYSESDDTCNESSCIVDKDQDTRFVKVGDSIKLIFKEPNTRPLHSGGDGTAIPSGTSYRIFLHLIGYDEGGQLYLQVIDYGITSY